MKGCLYETQIQQYGDKFVCVRARCARCQYTRHVLTIQRHTHTYKHTYRPNIQTCIITCLTTNTSIVFVFKHVIIHVCIYVFVWKHVTRTYFLYMYVNIRSVHWRHIYIHKVEHLGPSPRHKLGQRASQVSSYSALCVCVCATWTRAFVGAKNRSVTFSDQNVFLSFQRSCLCMHAPTKCYYIVYIPCHDRNKKQTAHHP